MERIFKNCFISATDKKIWIFPHIKTVHQLLEHKIYRDGYENVTVTVDGNYVRVALTDNSYQVENIYNFFGSHEYKEKPNREIIVSPEHLKDVSCGFLWWKESKKIIVEGAHWYTRKKLLNDTEMNIYNASDVIINKIGLNGVMQEYVNHLR